MWRRQSLPPTLLALLLLAACSIRPAGAVGPPIQLEDVKSFPFAFSPLRVADLDGVSGPDLSGIQGSGVVFAPNDGHGGFGSLQSIPLGTGTLGSYEARDLDGDGKPDLIAYSPGAGMIAIRLDAGGGRFTPPALTPVPGSAEPYTQLVLGDLNGDGRADAVMVLDSAYVAVMMNDGSGHLLPATRFVVDGAYTAPQLADFNGDGKADLLFRNWNTPAWYFLAGRGDGTFDAPVVTPTQAFSPFIVPSVADMDGDGDLDLVTSDESSVFILLNRGDGTFDPPVAVTSLGRANYLSDVEVGDLDHDGRPDIVVMDGSGMTNSLGGTANVRVGLNRGGLSFGPTTSYPILYGGLLLADLDGDGWLDVLVTSGGVDHSCLPGWRWPASSTFVFHNRMGALEGLFVVVEPVWLPARSGAGALPDLYGSKNGVMLRARNRGNGTFDSAEPIGWGDPRLARDIDRDGDDDLLVVSGDSTWVLPNLGAAGFGPPSFTMVGSTFRDFADFNGDGRLDLLATDPDSELVMFPGDGACGFGPALHFGRKVPAAPSDDVVRGADLNGDGFADVLCGHMEGESVGLGSDVTALLVALLNDRSGGFSPPESSVSSFRAGPNRPHHQGFLRLGDWNGDGVRDAILVSAACTELNFPPQCAFVGAGDGTFAGVSLPSTFSNSPCDVQVADLNGDRLDDLVRINDSSGCTFHAAVFTADGTGGFAERWYPMGYEPIAARLADLDGDGRLDLVTLNVDPFSWTTFSYSIRRNVTPIEIPTPTLVSLVSARFEEGIVRLDWFASSPYSAAIERRSSATGWSAIARAVSDGTGHLRYDDRAVVAGERYAYRLRLAGASGSELSAESWVSVPGVALWLRGAWPNPSRGLPTFALSIPSRGSAEIAVYDIAGRVVRRQSLDGLAPGAHRVGLTGPALEPGVYLARLLFAGRRVQTSFIVLR